MTQKDNNFKMRWPVLNYEMRYNTELNVLNFEIYFT